MNLADVWPTIMRMGPEPEVAGEGVARAGCTARPELDRPIVRVIGLHNDGGVLRYQA